MGPGAGCGSGSECKDGPLSERRERNQDPRAKAESRDDIVLWAVEANARQHLKRTNADKAHSVQQLWEAGG